MDLRAIAGFALDEAVSQDASFFNGVKRFMVEQPGKKKGEGKPTDLTSHDKRFHPDGFQKGDACKYRDNLEKDDDADSIEDSPNAGMLPKGVSVEACDITKQDVDAIVNAANRWMLGGGGVDGAIHRAAGPSLVEECRKYPADKNGFRVQTGEAKITGAGNLPAKHVIHTAGPDVRDFARLPIGGPTDMFGKFAGAADWDTVSEEDKKELARLLSNSYKNSLELAKENGCKSVAFPSISTGIFGYPVEEAAKTVSDTVGKFLKENPDMSVKMCIFDPNPQKQAQIIKAYEDAFASQNPKEQVVSDVEFDWDESTKEVNWGDGEVKVVGDGTRPILNNHDNMASLRKEVVEKSKDNIRRQHNYIGDSAQGQPQMLVDGKVYRFTASLAKHGLTVRNCSDNGSAAAIIGDIINNSVKVPKTPDGITYRIGMVDFGEPCAVLVSCFKSSSFDDVEDVVEVELMHSVNTKRGNATPGFIPSISSQSNISISQLRELWQRCFLEGVKNLKNKHRHEEPVQDEDDYSSGVKATTDLQKHDAKYHPNGYKQGDSCQYRDKLDKGDSVDDLDPENVDGENAPTDKATSAENASSVPAAFTNAENAVKNAIADIEGGNLSGVAGLAKLLDDYENEYGNVTGGAGAVKTIGGLLAKCKSQNGIMAQIYQKHMNALKAAAASSALPKGTKTPQDMRNEAATKIASALGAQLAQSKPTAVSKNAASAAGAQGVTVQPNQATANAQVQSTQPQTPPAPPAPPQYGPAASLPHNFTALPAGMNLDNFASWPRGGGSTGLRIYTDPNTGKKYGVKRSDGMPQGQNITKDVLLEDYLADQTLRIAGLDAPDGLLQVNPNDGRLYKVTEWHDNASGIGSGSPSMNTQLAEAYPMMAMTYNMDASQNGDNILVDKITGKLVFVDNGSSFGNRAQGARNAWFDSRTEADSTKDHKGVAQLASHGSQSMWANALGLPNISGRYDQHISSQDQDVILKQFAKYDMGGIASEVSRLRDGLYKSLGLTKPTKADAKFKNIETWAKSADALAAKFKTAKAPTGVGSQQGNKSQSQTVSPAQPQPQPSPQPATTHQGHIDISLQNLSSLPQQPTNVTGGFYCHGNQLTSLKGAPQTVSGNFFCYANSLTSLQGAPQSVGGDFDCADNQLTSLDGAPIKVGGRCDFKNNPGLTAKQIQDYKDFLKNPDPAHIDATGHYSEKALNKPGNATNPTQKTAVKSQPTTTGSTNQQQPPVQFVPANPNAPRKHPIAPPAAAKNTAPNFTQKDLDDLIAARDRLEPVARLLNGRAGNLQSLQSSGRWNALDSLPQDTAFYKRLDDLANNKDQKVSAAAKSLKTIADNIASSKAAGWTKQAGMVDDDQTFASKLPSVQPAPAVPMSEAEKRGAELQMLKGVMSSQDPKAPKAAAADMKSAHENMESMEEGIRDLDDAIAKEKDPSVKSALQAVLDDVEVSYAAEEKRYEDARGKIKKWNQSQVTMAEGADYGDIAAWYKNKGLAVPKFANVWGAHATDPKRISAAEAIVIRKFGSRNGWKTPAERQQRVERLRKNMQILMPHLKIYHRANDFAYTSIIKDGAVRADYGDANYRGAAKLAFGISPTSPQDMQLYTVLSLEDNPKNSSWAQRSSIVIEGDLSKTFGGVYFENGCGYWPGYGGIAMNMLSQIGFTDMAYGDIDARAAELDFSTMTPAAMFKIMFKAENQMEFHPANGLSIYDGSLKNVWTKTDISKTHPQVVSLLKQHGVGIMNPATGKPW